MFFIFLIFFSSLGLAEETSLRSLCRQRVAGIHLNYLDLEETLGPRIALLIKKNKELSEQIKKSEKELETVKKAVDENPTAMKNRNKAQDLSARVESLKTMLSENQKYLSAEEARKKEARDKLGEFRKKLPPTFKVVKEQKADIKGYAWTIVYSRECPRFRMGCALTESEKESLKKIFRGMEMPESCEKYLSINDIKDT